MPRVLKVPFLVVSLVFSGGYIQDAHAGRVLIEPPEIKKNVRRMKQKDKSAALKGVGLQDTCTRSMLKTKEIQGVRCRMALYQASAKKAALKTEGDFAKRLEHAKTALQTAKSIHAYSPMLKKPGLARHQFEAHKQSCATVLDAYDAIKALPNTSPARLRVLQKRALIGEGDAFNVYAAACDCTKKSLQLAGPARASLDESGELQGILTSRGCLVNRERLKSEREGPSGLSENAQKIAKANTDVSVLLDYAKARDIGLDRCRQKYVSSVGKVKKVGKMERCVCEEVKRWRFPKKRGRADVEFQLPVDGENVQAKLVIVAVGKIEECGPLSGKGIP
ncbi:MAG: hypothetical protein GY822_24725 [Deltaproteobacteria bacterium]|nr:hypothetical protein [Deltaproteobacteria bacterium]